MQCFCAIHIFVRQQEGRNYVHLMFSVQSISRSIGGVMLKNYPKFTFFPLCNPYISQSGSRVSYFNIEKRPQCTKGFLCSPYLNNVVGSYFNIERMSLIYTQCFCAIQISVRQQGVRDEIKDRVDSIQGSNFVCLGNNDPMGLSFSPPSLSLQSISIFSLQSISIFCMQH